MPSEQPPSLDRVARVARWRRHPRPIAFFLAISFWIVLIPLFYRDLEWPWVGPFHDHLPWRLGLAIMIAPSVVGSIMFGRTIFRVKGLLTMRCVFRGVLMSFVIQGLIGGMMVIFPGIRSGNFNEDLLVAAAFGISVGLMAGTTWTHGLSQVIGAACGLILALVVRVED